jgi:hypothetical protein
MQNTDTPLTAAFTDVPDKRSRLVLMTVSAAARALNEAEFYRTHDAAADENELPEDRPVVFPAGARSLRLNNVIEQIRNSVSDSEEALIEFLAEQRKPTLSSWASVMLANWEAIVSFVATIRALHERGEALVTDAQEVTGDLV